MILIHTRGSWHSKEHNGCPRWASLGRLFHNHGATAGKVRGVSYHFVGGGAPYSASEYNLGRVFCEELMLSFVKAYFWFQAFKALSLKPSTLGLEIDWDKAQMFLKDAPKEMHWNRLPKMCG